MKLEAKEIIKTAGDILRPLAGCDYSAEGNILLEDEETLISVPLRGVIADGGYRNIIVLVISNVPLRGVIAHFGGHFCLRGAPYPTSPCGV